MVNKKMDKNLLFEYLVSRLDEWKKNIESTGKSVPAFTKLRLQKILFLVCAWNATNTERKLLNVFDNFYALPYGPVEMDVYEAMKSDKAFKYISFNGNKCVYSNLEKTRFTGDESKEMKWVDDAVNVFVQDQRRYLYMPVFDLVELTHRWSAWKISMDIATILGNKKEEISVESICDSSVKAF